MIFSSSHVWMWGLDHKEKVRRKWKWSRSVMSDSLDPMDCSLWGSSVHGIFQARVLEWIAISFSRVSSWPRNRTCVSCIAGRRFTIWATREDSYLFIECLLCVKDGIWPCFISTTSSSSTNASNMLIPIPVLILITNILILILALMLILIVILIMLIISSKH